jgi:hypothetical protein
MLYFAYGSNMSSIRLRRRTPSAQFVAVANLDAHQLRFHKLGGDGSAKCDAFHSGNPAHQVMGVLFDVAATEIPALDRVEGLGQGYEKKAVLLNTDTHGRLEAFTYYATLIREVLAPFHWYKEHVVRGCIEHALPDHYLEPIHRVTSVPDPDELRAEREAAIYRQCR